MKLSRRSIMGALGMAPLAAKAAADEIVGRAAGLTATTGLGIGGVGLPGGALPQGETSPQNYVPYETRLAKASDLIRLTGMPAVVERQLRDQAAWVSGLDIDIACKRSWSMSVKIMTQRQRNYERYVEKIHAGAAQYRGKKILETILGFEWPS